MRVDIVQGHSLLTAYCNTAGGVPFIVVRVGDELAIHLRGYGPEASKTARQLATELLQAAESAERAREAVTP